MEDTKDFKTETTVTQVTLKLRDASGGEIEFRVKPSTKFAKVAKAYADKKNVSADSMRFLVDGERVEFAADPTVGDLGLEDGDYVDVELNQVGGH